jgi:hypothetical protein
MHVAQMGGGRGPDCGTGAEVGQDTSTPASYPCSDSPYRKPARRPYRINCHRMTAKTPLDVLTQLFSPPVNRDHYQSEHLC